MTQIVLNSPGEARGFLRAKGDAVELPDGSLRSYIWGKYGVVVDPSATVLSAPAPPARTDSLPRSASVYREDDATPAPRKFRDKHADAYNLAHGIVPSTPEAEASPDQPSTSLKRDDGTAAPRFKDKHAEAYRAAHRAY